MKIAYIDCSSGAAGDMLLAALIDAGASEDATRGALEALGLDGWELRIEEVTRAGLRALQAIVRVDDDEVHRSYRDIVGIIERARLDTQVSERALAVFGILAHAEGRVHDVAPEEVHFHEAGSLDAIVDIVGFCAAFVSLGSPRVVVSPIATGTGIVRSQHGELPLPAPAVAEILRGTGATVYGRGTRELVTPTGAALLAASAADFDNMPAMAIDAVGAGAGSADLDFPNVVRALIGTPRDLPSEPEPAVLVETNIDDMSPELLPPVIENLLAAGAQDAWLTPILMKKGRPAFTVSVLCAPTLEEDLVAILFRETTTLGTRTTAATKRALAREWVDTEVAGTAVRVKVGRYNGEITTLAPEHDDALAAAEAGGLPLKQVYAAASEEARRTMGSR